MVFCGAVWSGLEAVGFGEVGWTATGLCDGSKAICACCRHVHGVLGSVVFCRVRVVGRADGTAAADVEVESRGYESISRCAGR